jgi:ABC-2 family transporter protein
MRNLIALELAKHRKNFRSMGLLLALSIPVVTLAFLISGNLQLSEAIVYTVELAFFASAFLLPLYFGVAAGSGLRREPEKSTEDLLPASPLKRARAAYAVGLFHAVALGLALTIIFVLTQLEKASFRLEISDATFLFAGLYFYLICFLFGYLIRQPLVASGAAIFTILLNSSCLSMLRQMSYSWMVEYGHDMNWWTWTSALWLGITVLGLVIPGVFLVLLIRKMQRGINATFEAVAVICLLLLLPLTFIFFMFLRVRY